MRQGNAMPDSLAGKAAVITGAGRGIGRAIALAFAREGASLTLASRTSSELDSVAAEIAAEGGRAIAVVADVSSPGDVERLVASTLSSLGRLDAFVAAAGVLGPVGKAWDNEPAEWLDTLKVNLWGTYLCARSALKVMCEARSGSFIAVSGGGASTPRPNFSAYAASKAGLVRLVETLALEAAPYKVRANAIAPGMVETRMLRQILAAGPRAGRERNEVESIIKQKRTASPELTAELAVFVASDVSREITGKLISAVHDPWREWAGGSFAGIEAKPWYTLRRLDPHTLSQLGEEYRRS